MIKRGIRSVSVGFLSGMILLSGCKNSTEVTPSFSAETILQDQWIDEVSTDLAAYRPGDTVTFDLTLTEELDKGSLIVNYKHLDEVVFEEEIDLNGDKEVTWEWVPEGDDFTGYMTEIFLVQSNKVIDHHNIAVDVSSDWSKFPRYGYLADFYNIENDRQQAVIENLNRFHINGLQFYDWQDIHEKPIPIENGEIQPMWYDLANREVYLDTVETYIDLAHEKNMMAMNYNLLFGASQHYEEYGVKREWGVFKDENAEEQDVHPVPPAWKYDIHLFDPGNEEWQEFMFEAQKEVFDHLNFDGWHVDQLGDRSPWYTIDGELVDMPEAYRSLMNNAKEELDVRLVLNAVSMYAQEEIAETPVDFLYVESWDEPLYEDLKEIVDYNWELTDGELNTIFAAYINFDLSDSLGDFNTPGVLFRDAAIFASGGHNISLGENMLSKEYFPHETLNITDELHREMIRYYDFSVAYQNLLRDNVIEIERKVTSADLSITQNAEKGSVWTFSKQKDNKDILHFINLTDATSLEWRDSMGTQPEPEVQEDISIKVKVDQDVEKIWMASPDLYNGSSFDLDFEQDGDEITFILPSIKYWDMVVIEY